MENEYVKQFPELMKGKKIMYNHGFSSSAASGTVRLSCAKKQRKRSPT